MSNEKASSEQIAIIGISGEFPKSSSQAELWRHVLSKDNLIQRIPNSLYGDSLWAKELIESTNYIPYKGVLEHPTSFDAELFNMCRREAEYTDPQHRKLLQHSWAALEMAGYNPETYPGLISVFASTSISSYFYFNVLPNIEKAAMHSSDEMLGVLGCDKDFIATRISYKLNLRGVSQTIQTACSSSLVSVHAACENLLNFESDIALAASASITFPTYKGYIYTEEGITSRDGQCRPFDCRSSGTVSGNGCGVIALKRLDEALHDRDTIHAVIRGSAVNNDGSNKVGFMAPSAEGQARVIHAAHMSAEVAPNDVSYVEAHGTGTQLGDPIELSALSKVFGKDSHFKCYIGSVKANIGHLDAAAGMAGLFNLISSIQHKTIPPLLHFSTQNPNLGTDIKGFLFPKEPVEWKADQKPRIAGISSFGIGGTNSHLIIQEAPAAFSSKSMKEYHLFPFSANTSDKLRELLSTYASFLKDCHFRAADIAFTLQVGRKSLPKRVCFSCRNISELYKIIEKFLASGIFSHSPSIPQELLDSASRWSSGQVNSLQNLYLNEIRNRVPLPTYPFDSAEYCLETEQIFHKESSPILQHEGPIDELVEMIWKRVLKAQDLNDNSDFFHLGGDSLLALELLDEMKTSCFIELKLQDLFEHSNLRSFIDMVYDRLLQLTKSMSKKEAEKILLLL